MKFCNEAIAQYIEALRETEEKGKLGYAIARNLRKMEDEAKEYLKIKNDALMKYGDKVERPDGSIYFSLPMSNTEQVRQFMDEIGEIGNAEIDVDIFTVPEETFYSGNLTSRQMSILLWMIDQPKTKSEKAKE